MSVELLSCPFCGSEPDYSECPDEWTLISCANRDCLSNVEVRDCCEDAIKAWNTRAVAWPVGSLQWAIDNAPKNDPRIRRKAWAADECVIIVNDGRQFLRWSYGAHFVLSVENALATDWEVCE